jgi:aminoglycoside phosphotransferase (APT) family kinase protein
MTTAVPDPRLVEFIYAQSLATRGSHLVWTPLTGGVSSDIWRVVLPDRTLCVKCALPKLKVAQDWQVPVSRNAFEWAWLCFAAEHYPDAVPQPVAHDAEQGIFAMDFLVEKDYPNWKQLLMGGVVSHSAAVQVGAVLAGLHAASANNEKIAKQFQSTDIFFALRLDPYLLTAAKHHPDLEPALRELVDRTIGARIALVHGDVSPKNILIGKAGPVFLDAECAWYGDPAFDVAFCLNHFLLKCVAKPALTDAYLECFAGFTEAYLSGVTWESREAIEARAANLLPGLLLARVDGKSPVEYVTETKEKDLIRAVARQLLLAPVSQLSAIAQTWQCARFI